MTTQIDGEIKEIYESIKYKIISRLNDFEYLLRNGSEEEIFVELVFCLLTSQSKARVAGRCGKSC
ncbi:MAG: hypothetical protein DRO92_04260 [Candidatus Altiarchaeales archaeon]|nr:MAG: hypothetical protein DRO92_04260 [Candidatus Altiarchaeales archaeon]